ncbi:type II toxin-antitoxin system HicA family toxin [Patescibacteria group bacterium]|nr:type II toxin-antitoxin system HicA family toxin [Patescibacteria group bacterium]
MGKRRKIPSMSSKKLIRLVEKGGALFSREGKGDHIIYKRMVKGRLVKAPILENKQELPGIYSLVVFKQLGFSDKEIDQLLE